MLNTCTAKYIRLKKGCMGQLIEWPEIVTESKNLEDCREMLKDALHEMVIAYKLQKKFESA